MASQSSTNNNDHEGDNDNSSRRLITKAVRYARVSLRDRLEMRLLVTELNRQASLTEIGNTPTPPPQFRAALRQPIGSRRRTVSVMIGGKRVPLLLNPQGRRDPEREQWLWEFICARVLRGAE